MDVETGSVLLLAETLSCGHVFHTECVHRWFLHRSCPVGCCPMCRAIVVSKQDIAKLRQIQRLPRSPGQITGPHGAGYRPVGPTQPQRPPTLTEYVAATLNEVQQNQTYLACCVCRRGWARLESYHTDILDILVIGILLVACGSIVIILCLKT